MNEATLLRGDGTWPWTATVDGDDIVVQGIATAFGGDDDSQDDGSTASGFNTKGHSGLMACSLPMRDDKLKALRGSPIPRMPFGLHADGTRNPEGTWVAVTFDRLNNPPAVLPVIDLGPGKRTGHVLDLTVAAARLRDPGATANDFMARVTYRIIGGAKYVKETSQAAETAGSTTN
jgi:hypothetical protein